MVKFLITLGAAGLVLCSQKTLDGHEYIDSAGFPSYTSKLETRTTLASTVASAELAQESIRHPNQEQDDLKDIKQDSDSTEQLKLKTDPREQLKQDQDATKHLKQHTEAAEHLKEDIEVSEHPNTVVLPSPICPSGPSWWTKGSDRAYFSMIMFKGKLKSVLRP